MSKSQVAILAGGKGTRLSSVLGNIPKPMVHVVGRPLLLHQIELCRKYGFTNIALLVHHHHEKISDFFCDGSSFGVSIKYFVESSPRGTAGALRDALPHLAERFLVLYGDTFIDVDLRKMWKMHSSSGARCSLLLHPNDHPHDSDLVEINKKGFVSCIHPYPHSSDLEFRNLVNAALYIFDNKHLEEVISAEGKSDIAKDMFPNMLSSGLSLYGYISSEYIKDMGTPERLYKVEQDIIAGLPERLSSRNLRNAVFMDRDGTLIREVNHLKSADQLELLPNVATAVRRLNRNGTLAVVVTNQPVVARGDITLEGLAKVHARLETKLGAEGAFLDGLYFCPHHPDKGFPGEVSELKKQCFCRKPEPGLIDQACRDLKIDRRDSWIIGDTTSDIEAGRRAGIRSILVRTGYAGSDSKYVVKPDYICPDLPDAIDWILNGHTDMARKMAKIAEAACCDVRVVLIGGLARAGKSFAAQVLKELLHGLGRRAHVVSLDGWLKPKHLRSEGSGVCDRYDLSAASELIAAVASSRSREVLLEPIYDRNTRNAGALTIEHSVGPDDILIIEGVPALLMDELNSLPEEIKVYMDSKPTVRTGRLIKDYACRGLTSEEHEALLASRELDETPLIKQSSGIADFIVMGNLKEAR